MMKKYLLLLPMFCLCLATVLAAEPSVVKLDLAGAVEAAMAKNSTVISAQAALSTAEANVKAELAKISPGCTVSFNYDQALADGSGSGSLEVTVSQKIPGLLPLTIGGKTAGAVQQALWDQADRKGQLEAAKLAAAAETTRKYLAALQADQTLLLKERALEMAKEDEKIARAKLAAGTATELETLKAESSREQSELNLEEAKSARRDAYDALLAAMGRNFGEDLTLVSAQTTTPEATKNLETLTAEALAASADLGAARTKVRKAEAALQSAKNSTLPSLQVTATEKQDPVTLNLRLDLISGDLQWSANGRKDWSSAGASTPSTVQGLSLGLEFSWNPFDGGAGKATIAKAQLDLESAQRALAQQESDLKLDIRQRLEALSLARRRLIQAQKDRGLAAQSREVAKIRYEEGVTLFSELSQATQELAQAEYNLVQRGYDLLQTWIGLEQACGRQAEPG